MIEWNEQHKQIRDMLRRFVEAEIAPKREELEFGDQAPVLMTEKDAVKLRRHARANWWVLPVTAQLEPAFGDWLSGRLDGFRRRSKAA